MTRVALRQIIGGSRTRARWCRRIADALGAPVAIEDAEGRLLHGDGAGRTARRVSRCCTTTPASAGSSGPERARAVAALLEHLAAREVERKALGAEVLHLYREINLIYSFSEKLAALLDLERVARAHAAGSASPDRRHRRRDHAARRGDRRARRRWPASATRCRRSTGFRTRPRHHRRGRGERHRRDRQRRGQRPAARRSSTRRCKALIARAAEGRRAGHRRHRARQHDADGLHGRAS